MTAFMHAADMMTHDDAARAARYLAETRNFDGTVHFVFQPRRGERMRWQAMVEAGLSPASQSSVYGMHKLAWRSGRCLRSPLSPIMRRR